MRARVGPAARSPRRRHRIGRHLRRLAALAAAAAVVSAPTWVRVLSAAPAGLPILTTTPLLSLQHCRLFHSLLMKNQRPR